MCRLTYSAAIIRAMRIRTGQWVGFRGLLRVAGLADIPLVLAAEVVQALIDRGVIMYSTGEFGSVYHLTATMSRPCAVIAGGDDE